MNELTKIIRKIIKSEGAISVANFMQLALQHPKYGYYTKGQHIGKSGDFITSPEISQIFGELIGLWCLDMWIKEGAPDQFVLLELGAGNGTLIQDALRATKNNIKFQNAINLYFIESNDDFKKLQCDKCKKYNPKHIENIIDLPKLPAYVIANEFLDAMPVHQYVCEEGVCYERLVSIKDDKFVFIKGKANNFINVDKDLSFYELSPNAISVVKDITNHIMKYGGSSILIDYGYVKSNGSDSLQAVSNHNAVDPLSLVGEVDLTAHVDFHALKKTSNNTGGFVPDIISQREFLKNMGIDIRTKQLKINATNDQKYDIDKAVERLTGVNEMGSLFKVMAISSNKIKNVTGF